MKQQTAVEWLVKELNLEGYDFTIERAKQMEKQQIEDAYQKGYEKGCIDIQMGDYIYNLRR